jgi:hypothetical protein
VLALKIVLGFVLKKGAEWPWLCRELFFDQTLDEAKLNAYMRNLKVRGFHPALNPFMHAVCLTTDTLL